MRKKLEGNEFKSQQRMVRPNLDPKELERISAAISKSFQDQIPITVVTFDMIEYEKEITGVVTRIDQQLKRLKIENNEEIEWVPFYDVLLVRM